MMQETTTSVERSDGTLPFTQHNGVSVELATSVNDATVPKAPDFSGFRKPFKFGWKREIVNSGRQLGKKRFDIYYYAPNGKKLRSKPEIGRFLSDHNIHDLFEHDFTFAHRSIDGPPHLEYLREAGKRQHASPLLTKALTTLKPIKRTDPLSVRTRKVVNVSSAFVLNLSKRQERKKTLTPRQKWSKRENASTHRVTPLRVKPQSRYNPPADIYKKRYGAQVVHNKEQNHKVETVSGKVKWLNLSDNILDASYAADDEDICDLSCPQFGLFQVPNCICTSCGKFYHNNKRLTNLNDDTLSFPPQSVGDKHCKHCKQKHRRQQEEEEKRRLLKEAEEQEGSSDVEILPTPTTVQSAPHYNEREVQTITLDLSNRPSGSGDAVQVTQRPGGVSLLKQQLRLVLDRPHTAKVYQNIVNVVCHEDRSADTSTSSKARALSQQLHRLQAEPPENRRKFTIDTPGAAGMSSNTAPAHNVPMIPGAEKHTADTYLQSANVTVDISACDSSEEVEIPMQDVSSNVESSVQKSTLRETSKDKLQPMEIYEDESPTVENCDDSSPSNESFEATRNVCKDLSPTVAIEKDKPLIKVAMPPSATLSKETPGATHPLGKRPTEEKPVALEEPIRVVNSETVTVGPPTLRPTNSDDSGSLSEEEDSSTLDIDDDVIEVASQTSASDSDDDDANCVNTQVEMEKPAVATVKRKRNYDTYIVAKYNYADIAVQHPRIISPILSMLPTATLIQCRQLSRLWKETVDTYLRRHGLNTLDTTISSIDNLMYFCANIGITSLSLNFADSDSGTEKQSGSKIDSIIQHMNETPNVCIKSLRIISLSSVYVQKLISFSGLSELHLLDIVDSRVGSALDFHALETKRQTKKVQALTLTFEQLTVVPRDSALDLVSSIYHLKNLRHLILTNFAQIPSDLHMMFRYITKLEKLCLGQIGHLPDEFYISLNDLTELKVLSLESGSFAHNEFPSFLQSMPKLKELSLCHMQRACHALPTSINLPTFLPNLTSLHMTACYEHATRSIAIEHTVLMFIQLLNCHHKLSQLCWLIEVPAALRQSHKSIILNVEQKKREIFPMSLEKFADYIAESLEKPCNLDFKITKQFPYYNFHKYTPGFIRE